MTFEEILEKAKQNKIDVFEAYDLLKERLENIAEKDLDTLNTWNSKKLGAYKNSESHKNNEAESFKCTELMNTIIKQCFDDFSKQKYCANYLFDIARAIFSVVASENANEDVKIINEEKSIAKKVIDSRIKFLQELREKLDRE